MDRLKIQGGVPLSGEVEVSGAKNSALPILFASLLTDKVCEFERVPDLHDIYTTLGLLKHLGVSSEFDVEHHSVRLDASKISTVEAPYELVRKMRASVLALGPLLARFGSARVSLPGGCAIGARPVNFHIEGLKKLGAQIEIIEGYIVASTGAGGRLVGNKVEFPYASVGATENLMLAASLARGETVLENCAREPEIIDLGEVLKKMGVVIEGTGTSTIQIQGRDALGGVQHAIIGDRIEAGTFLIAAFATGGAVTVQGVCPDHLDAVLKKLAEAGARITRTSPTQIRLESEARPKPVNITTEPYPGFPTDMQAQFMTLMCLSTGKSEIREHVFENRFMHVQELARLGAEITIEGSSATVEGKERLVGAQVMATDLRASASLVIAGLAAQGTTEINRVYHLDRGYERMERKLQALGARIERIREG